MSDRELFWVFMLLIGWPILSVIIGMIWHHKSLKRENPDYSFYSDYQKPSYGLVFASMAIAFCVVIAICAVFEKSI